MTFDLDRVNRSIKGSNDLLGLLVNIFKNCIKSEDEIKDEDNQSRYIGRLL